MRWLSQLRRFVVVAMRFCQNQLILGNELVATLRAVLPRRDPGVSGMTRGLCCCAGRRSPRAGGDTFGFMHI